MFNLVHNALDAMKACSSSERTLRVRTEKRGRNAIGISVQDSGPGIEPGQIDRIFDPFVTTKKDGMGMGLADLPDDRRTARRPAFRVIRYRHRGALRHHAAD